MDEKSTNNQRTNKIRIIYGFRFFFQFFSKSRWIHIEQHNQHSKMLIKSEMNKEQLQIVLRSHICGQTISGSKSCMPMNSLFSLFHYNLSGLVCLLFIFFCFHIRHHVSFGWWINTFVRETCHISIKWNFTIDKKHHRFRFIVFILHLTIAYCLQTFNVQCISYIF